jgi:hypothetical protein
LEEAASAYRNALTRHDRDHAPLEWAQMQHNLGSVLEMIGDRGKGTAALEASIAALRSALEIRTRERLPLDWGDEPEQSRRRPGDIGKARGRHAPP